MTTQKSLFKTEKQKTVFIAMFVLVAGGMVYTGFVATDGDYTVVVFEAIAGAPLLLGMAGGGMRGLTVGGLVGLAIAIFVLAAILPSAITQVETANTTGWDASAVALWGIIGIVIVAGVVVGIWKLASG